MFISHQNICCRSQNDNVILFLVVPSASEGAKQTSCVENIGFRFIIVGLIVGLFIYDVRISRALDDVAHFEVIGDDWCRRCYGISHGSKSLSGNPSSRRPLFYPSSFASCDERTGYTQAEILSMVQISRELHAQRIS